MSEYKITIEQIPPSSGCLIVILAGIVLAIATTALAMF